MDQRTETDDVEQSSSFGTSLGEIGLNQFVPYLLNRISGAWNASLAEELKSFGLTTTKMRALATVSVAPGITVNELAVLAVTEQSTLSRTLDALEEQGLIRRRSRAGDLRMREVYITEDGNDLFARVWPMMFRMHGQLLAGIDQAELRDFIVIAQKIMRNMKRFA
jgi:MarR family transcriptional regulator for hemolysin